MSGSIFALAIDPLIRKILAASVLHSIRITAFADDIAIAVANLFLQLPGIMVIFSQWAVATVLKLKPMKTAILPLAVRWCDDPQMAQVLGPGPRGLHRGRCRQICLLYTYDAADEQLCVDLGGSRLIVKKIRRIQRCTRF